MDMFIYAKRLYDETQVWSELGFRIKQVDSSWTAWPLKMEPICRLETLVTNYQSTKRYTPLE